MVDLKGFFKKINDAMTFSKPETEITELTPVIEPEVKKKGFLKKISDAIGFKAPEYELTPERETEIIEKWAGTISKHGMELPSLLFLWPLEPLSTVIAYTTILPVAPILDFLGFRGFEKVLFLSDHSNVKRLLKRIEELEKEKKNNKGFWD